MLEDTTFTDATVVAESRKFHWVTVLRDSVPDVTKRFNVSAFPSLMVIGRNEEKVYRWSGYKLPEPFMEELDEALRRYRLYSRGKEWDTPDPRPETVIDEVAIEFPELRIVCGHIGYPWTTEMIAVATKHPNVFIDTSAYTAKRYPSDLVEYLNKHGRKKVLFGTNYPMITPAKCLEGIDEMLTDDEVKELFLFRNAHRIFKID